MVYTVTFNPSLDYIVTVDDFKLGLTNRTESELMLPGGKGINVSIVLSNLGIENSAIYYSAGFVGDEITRRVKESGITSEEIKLSGGCSRINLKLKSIDGTEINGMGPDISDEDIGKLYEKLDKIEEGDTLVLAGSIPSTMPASSALRMSHPSSGTYPRWRPSHSTSNLSRPRASRPTSRWT